MSKTDIDSLHDQILQIKHSLQDLADDLTPAEELNPDFTLIEIAKIYTCLLNISSKIYQLRPDLVPEHLKDCTWHDYIPK